MMSVLNIFLSYSHKDEWLKDEMLTHLSAMRRRNSAFVWHDRKIKPGDHLETTIRAEAERADIYLFLISADFIDSEYCMTKEFKWANDRAAAGKAIIIPIIVRECDWNAANLKSYSALPLDGKASEALSFNPDYISSLFLVKFIRHPNRALFDEQEIFVEPELMCEADKLNISTTAALIDRLASRRAALIVGGERSGKTLLTKILQREFHNRNEPTIVLASRNIHSTDILALVRHTLDVQYMNRDLPLTKVCVVLDNFDECKLSDTNKEQVMRDLAFNTARTIVLSFSNAPAILFTHPAMPDLAGC